MTWTHPNQLLDTQISLTILSNIWQFMAFPSGTGSKRLTGARGVEDVGKRTRSDSMETVRPGKSRPHSPEVSSRETENIS